MEMDRGGAKGLSVFSWCGKNVLWKLWNADFIPIRQFVGNDAFVFSGFREPERFAPELDVAFEEKLSWLNVGDELPKRKGPGYL